MRCWLLAGGSSLESIMVFGVTPLALCGSAQVLMVLISGTYSSMVVRRRENILHGSNHLVNYQKQKNVAQTLAC